MRLFRFGSVASLVILLYLLAAATTLAGEGEEGASLQKITARELTFPSESFRKVLSGRNWLITSGLDPALGIDLGGPKEAPPLSGGGAPSSQAGGGAALVPYRDPSAKFSRNILIPSDFSQLTYQTEPSLAVDPKDPDHILVGMIDYNFPNMVTYSSIDAGATWEGPVSAKYPRNDLGAAGDPVVAFDRKGNAYYAFIALDVEEYTVGPILGSAMVSSISVASSTDGATSWGEALESSRSTLRTTTLPSTDGRLRGEITVGFFDKPWMTIGRHPTDPAKDVIYVTYTNFIETARIYWIDELPFLGSGTLETVIELVRSEDGGVTWSKPIEVSPRARYAVVFDDPKYPITQEEVQQGTTSRRVIQGSDVAVAPDGSVYVAWLDSTDDDSFEGLGEIYVSRSDNAGVTFQAPRRAAGFLEPSFQSRNTAFRSWAGAFPKLGIGPGGEVHVLWMAIPTDRPDDDGDIFAVSSTDKGRNWSRRVRVNDDETSSFQFFPEVSVDPKGTIHAMWGDYRDDPKHVSFHIYYASSEDGGKTWTKNSRVSDFPTNPNKAFPRGRFIGDYFAIEATADDVYMVWADGRLGEFGAPNQKIGFARKRLMPNPSIFISPPSGPGGRPVDIQGFNFQPNKSVFIEVAGVIVSTTRTQDDGRFLAKIFIPISGEGSHTVRAIEESGNVAPSSFFMDFGFDTLQRTTNKLDALAGKVDTLGAGPQSSITELTDKVGILSESVDALKAEQAAQPSGVSTSTLVLIIALALVPILIGLGVLAVLVRRFQAKVS